ncbi:glycosyltransferase family 4 protein [Novispirillum sp. DQ9]|uniref:glycosyltransferase family 4 protein n=1 Tax=Novispirillum sp. DQ9 TaxID=3398612 RepID=UPI003C7C3797
MRIAQVAPLYESVPPRFYGGTERVVAALCDALVDLGHDVTLFASGESSTKAALAPARARALRLDAGLSCDVAAHLMMVEQVWERAAQFDMIHFHIDCLQVHLCRDIAHKTLTTLHGRLDLTDLRPFLMRWRQFPLVSISNHQRQPVRAANFAGTVYHGFPTTQFDFTAAPEDGYLAFLGRISPEKRVDRAIEITTRSGVPLRIAAKVDAVDATYFHTTIEPLLDHPLVEFIGEIGDDQKSEFLGNARALLFPIDWPEPFGLVMIEAMACGTPVIAWPHGAVPEVLEHGVTGFLVEDVEAAVKAVSQLGALDRSRVRQVFEERFSAQAMARAYLAIYERLTAERQPMTPPHVQMPEPGGSAPWVVAAASTPPSPTL